MASRRLLKDTVVLANYVGEVDDVATYQYTTLKNVYCYTNHGVAVDNLGRRGNDSANLFIFDAVSTACDSDGNARTYLEYEKWKDLEDKTPFWTLYDGGKDTFRKEGAREEYRIRDFNHLVQGTRRMWHFEVTGR